MTSPDTSIALKLIDAELERMSPLGAGDLERHAALLKRRRELLDDAGDEHGVMNAPDRWDGPQ